MGKLKSEITDLLKYRDLFALLVERDIKLKYRRSFLGYLWSVLNPLLMMAVMVVVFSTMFQRNIENFPVYLLTGQTLFNFMREATTQSMHSIIGNAGLLKKTYVPKALFVFSRVTSSFVNLLFSMAALIIVMIVTGVGPSWYMLLAPVPLIEVYLFSLGLGLFLAEATVFFRDINNIWSVVTLAWMYLTPIFYPITALPEKLQNIIKMFNPMYCYIGFFRNVILDGQLPGYKIVCAGLAWIVIMLTLGIWSFNRNQDRFILYI